MNFSSYYGILRRRWAVIFIVLLADVLVSGYVFAKSYRHRGYQACMTLYVADVSSPSLVAAAPTSLQQAGQLLAGETAANFFADDIVDVVRSERVAAYVTQRVATLHLPNTAKSDSNGSISSSRVDRTVSVCVSNPNQASALAVDAAAGQTMVKNRASFVGKNMAHRTFVSVVSNPSAGRPSIRHDLLTLALQITFGILVAIGLALAWDALDPAVRDSADVERLLGVSVLRSSAS